MRERVHDQSPKDPGDTVIDHIQTDWIRKRPAHIRKQLERLTDDDWEKVLLTVTACAERRAKGKRGLWKRDNKTARAKAVRKARFSDTLPTAREVRKIAAFDKHNTQVASRGGKASKRKAST